MVLYVPDNASKREIYKGTWIDHDKNGVKDVYDDPSAPVEKRVDDLLSKMTLEEKLAEVRSSFNAGDRVGNLSTVLRALPAEEAAKAANDIQRKALEETRLGIPVIVHDECLHGLVGARATSFPQAIALASTWEPQLVYRVAKLIARETKARGIRQCLSPVVNLAQDARAGRTEETYGEDPLLSSKMGEAYVRALAEEGVVATPKHFIANFSGDGGRDSAEVHVSERYLRETELKPFASCIRAGALSIMAAYNSLDGVPCSANRWLLTDLLRGELGFRGFVVSDYGSVEGILTKHRVASGWEETAKLAMEAGLDVELPNTAVYGKPLEDALKKGLITQEVLDEAVRRVLRVKFLIGLFDEPYVDPAKAEDPSLVEEADALSLEAARKSLVLLKNDGLLPLRSDVKRVAVIGALAKEVRLGGYSGTPRRAVSALEAISEMAKEKGITVEYEEGYPADVDLDLPIPLSYFELPEGETPGKKNGFVLEYFDNPELSGKPVAKELHTWSYFSLARADWGYDPPRPELPRDSYSVRARAIFKPPAPGNYRFKLLAEGGVARLRVGNGLAAVSENGSTAEASAYVGPEGSEFTLEYTKRGYGYAYLKLGGVKEGNDGIKRAVELASKSDAVLIFAGISEGEQKDRASLRLPGPQENLIEEVLKVKGKGVAVFLVTGGAVTGSWIGRVPALVEAWYPGQNGGRALAELIFGGLNPSGKLPISWPREEGQLPLYYYAKPTGRVNDYVNAPPTPAFPFGHGLSYTQFEYQGLVVRREEGKWVASFTLKNVGQVAGEEVVQAYARALKSFPSEGLKLVAFERVGLQPGEAKRVELVIPFSELYGPLGKGEGGAKPNKAHQLLIGASAMDLRLAATLELRRPRSQSRAITLAPRGSNLTSIKRSPPRAAFSFSLFAGLTKNSMKPPPPAPSSLPPVAPALIPSSYTPSITGSATDGSTRFLTFQYSSATRAKPSKSSLEAREKPSSASSLILRKSSKWASTAASWEACTSPDLLSSPVLQRSMLSSSSRSERPGRGRGLNSTVSSPLNLNNPVPPYAAT